MDIGTSMLLGVLFGSFGMGFLIYGRKQRNAIALGCGLALCVFPFFVQTLYLFLFIGIALTIIPFVIRL